MVQSASLVAPPAMHAPSRPRMQAASVYKYYRSETVRWGRRMFTAQNTALENIDLSVAPGEVVSLLGPSGCGKTSLLRIIAGLSQADSGSVSVEGRLVDRPAKDTALVFQHFGLLPWRTVIDNVAFPLELYGVAETERRDTAERYLRMVGLSGYELRYPHQLSGGMQQRVGIARALTRQPLLLLMDEPFGALDAQTREELQEELLNILAQTRNTVIFVTHSISEAVRLSNRVAVFTPSPGRIKQMIDVPDTLRVGGDGRSSAEARDLEAHLRESLREDRHGR